MIRKKKRFIPTYGGGIPVRYDEKKKEYYYEGEDFHTSIEGPTGIGKTTRVYIPMIYILSQLKENMIITDNKLQMYYATKKTLEKAGYDVIMINYRDTTYGQRLNLMSELINHIKSGDLDAAQMEAIDLASSLVPRSENSEPMWGDGSESALASVMLALCLHKDMPDSCKSVSNVFNNIIQLGKSDDKGSVLDGYFESSDRTEIEKIAYGNYGMSSSKVRMSFNTMATSAVREFSFEKIKKQTAVSDFDLRNYTKTESKPIAIFVVTPDEKESMNNMGPSVLEYCYRVLVDESNKSDSGSLPTRWHMILDEFTNNGKFKNFVQRLTLARGRGIFYHVGIQDRAQVQSKYGEKDAESIFKNMGVRLWTATSTQEEVEELKKIFGYTSVVGLSQTQNQRGLFDFGIRRDSHSYQAKQRSVIDNDFLTQLSIPDVIVKRRGMYAFKSHLPVWMDTELKNILEVSKFSDLSPREEDEKLEYWKLLVDIDAPELGVEGLFSALSEAMNDHLEPEENSEDFPDSYYE